MKISKVETYHVQCRLSKKAGGSGYMEDSRNAVLVKISTDEGLVGWGETVALAGVRRLIEEQFASLLIGHDPVRDHRKLWPQLWGRYFHSGPAVSAVDMALHDLRGKAFNVSIGDLYGGRLRDRVAVYASGMNYSDRPEPSDHFVDEARDLAERGFMAMKMRIGRLPPKHDLAVAAVVREVVGPEIKLMADGNGGYSFATALAVGQELHRLGYYWFEEPLPEESYRGYEALREKLPLPLAGGEILDSRDCAKDLIVRGIADILLPDVSLCGGIGEWLFVAEMARLWGIQINPHCWAGPVVIAATVHVLSLLPEPSLGALPELPMLELDVSENPLRDDIAVNPLMQRDGWVAVPTGPGLGVEIDEAAVKHYDVV
jgi:D-galactarolactone cycloisomerase